MFKFPRRQVPAPSPTEPHRSANPLFSTPSSPWTSFRRRVYVATVLSLAFLGLIFLAYGPWFRITEVTVVGTRLLTPHSITTAAEAYLARPRLLIFPNRTLWILSAKQMTRTLEGQIRQRISIERLTIEKRAPRSLRIVVTERTPVATWTDGTVFGTVDRQGKIIDLQPAPVSNLPLVRDEAARGFTVDAGVVKPGVMDGLITLVTLLRQSNIVVKEFIIPDAPCPALKPTVPTSNTNSTGSLNTNLGRTTVNINTSLTEPSNTNQTTSPLECDRDALRFASQEIHALLEEGPRVLFDRHGNLSQAVQALRRVLAEGQGAKKTVQIDVRFGERVYVK